MAKNNCWLVTFVTSHYGSTYYGTFTFESTNKGRALYHQITEIGDEWVKTLGNDFPPKSAIVLALVCLGTEKHNNNGRTRNERRTS